ncbi:DUF6355 family natural product biosynthesis protein [Actinosynnema sp. NPDC023587]|uniref:DUF6355 family natural product biosynthesis protein n=1 Tax=Actinosynnema sp. NPDC023587 TaxID=3154695 RepID=UPI003406FEC9
MRALRAAAAVGFAALGLVFTAVPAIATPVTETGAVTSEVKGVDACGFWENHSTAYYTHCSTNCIWIVVDYSSGPNQYKQIPGYGDHDIGGAGAVDNAWYSHVC